MDILELNTIRKSLAIVDSSCLLLEFLDVEKLWDQYVDWKNKDFIIVSKQSIKNFLSWLIGDSMSIQDKIEIYNKVDKISGIDEI